jgi:hypothetical protein
VRQAGCLSLFPLSRDSLYPGSQGYPPLSWPSRALSVLHSRLRMNTLIADDDDIARLLLSSALTKLGHDVHEATNGGEAWNG